MQITGARTLRRTLARAPEEVRAETVAAVGAGAGLIEAQMLVNVPRDSGDLASVIATKFARDRMSAKIGAGVRGKRDQRKAGWRAHFVEFGTQTQAAQPFVNPAFQQHKERIRGALGKAVARALLNLAGKGDG